MDRSTVLNSTHISANDISDAAARIAPWLHRTPVMTSELLDDAVGCSVFVKCENFQRGGSFKARGAHNMVFSLDPDQARKGVVGTSSGNHAQGLAIAARNRGIDATVVMHNNAPQVKVDAVKGYGASILPVEPTTQARESTLAAFVGESGATVIPPYDHDLIIAGAGTATRELLGQIPNLDLILVPVGGGGLSSGTALSAHFHSADVRVIGCEPAGADDAFRSLRDKTLYPAITPAATIADGLLTGLSERTFAILSDHLEQIITVTDDQIVEAMHFIWTRMKIVIEPSAAVAVAVGLNNNLSAKRIGIIVSGGNAEPL